MTEIEREIAVMEARLKILRAMQDVPEDIRGEVLAGIARAHAPNRIHVRDPRRSPLTQMVIDVLERGPARMHDIRRAMPDESPASITNVLVRLVGRGVVSKPPKGGAWALVTSPEKETVDAE